MADFDVLIEIFDSILEKNSKIKVDESKNYADISWSPENIKSMINFLKKIGNYLSEMEIEDEDLSLDELKTMLYVGSSLVKSSYFFICSIEDKKTFLKDNIDLLMKKIKV